MPSKILTQDTDTSLFLDFLDPAFTLFDLAIRHELSLDDLLDWSEHPDTHTRITRLHTLITFRNSFLASSQLPTALTSLSAAAARTPDPSADPALAQRTAESARRAAAQLARLATQATPCPAGSAAPHAAATSKAATIDAPTDAPNPQELSASLPPEPDADPDPTPVYTSTAPSNVGPNPPASAPAAEADAPVACASPPLKSETSNSESRLPTSGASPFAAAPIPRAAAHPDGWS